MTHEELLALLKGEVASAAFRMDKNAWLVVSDIMELCHKWETEGSYCLPIKDIINVIEKELL